MKSKLFAVLFLLILNSCKINGSFQGLYSYYKVTKKTNPELFVTDGIHCELKNVGIPKVYLTNGFQLKKCINTAEYAVVYLWSPKCTSIQCIPLEIIASKCKNEQIQLSIVAQYYDADTMSKTYNIEEPIFGIDTKYYRSNLTPIYLKKFIADLTSKTNPENKKFLLFKKGQFINSFDSFDTLEFEYFKNKTK